MNRLKFFIGSVVAGFLLLAATPGSAGTLTPSASPSPQPRFNPTNVISANTIALQQTSPSVLKILGNATITPGAGASAVTLTLTGTFTANPNEFASFFYNFNIALNSNTPATFNLTLAANITSPLNLPLSTSTGNQAVAANSNRGYTGAGQTTAAPLTSSGNFTATLTFNFAAGTTASDNLILTIPNNSIDFSVAATAIPEPSTYALLALGAVGLAFHFRRRSSAIA